MKSKAHIFPFPKAGKKDEVTAFWSCVVFFLACLVYGILSGWKYKIEERMSLREHGNEEQDYHTDTSQKIAKQESQHASQQGFSKNHENSSPQQKQKNSWFNPQTWKKFYYGELTSSDPTPRILPGLPAIK